MAHWVRISYNPHNFDFVLPTDTHFTYLLWGDGPGLYPVYDLPRHVGLNFTGTKAGSWSPFGDDVGAGKCSSYTSANSPKPCRRCLRLYIGALAIGKMHRTLPIWRDSDGSWPRCCNRPPCASRWHRCPIFFLLRNFANCESNHSSPHARHLKMWSGQPLAMATRTDHLCCCFPNDDVQGRSRFGKVEDLGPFSTRLDQCQMSTSTRIWVLFLSLKTVISGWYEILIWAPLLEDIQVGDVFSWESMLKVRQEQETDQQCHDATSEVLLVSQKCIKKPRLSWFFRSFALQFSVFLTCGVWVPLRVTSCNLLRCPSAMSDLLVKPLPERVKRLEKARDSMRPLLDAWLRWVFWMKNTWGKLRKTAVSLPTTVKPSRARKLGFENPPNSRIWQTKCDRLFRSQPIQHLRSEHLRVVSCNWDLPGVSHQLRAPPSRERSLRCLGRQGCCLAVSLQTLPREEGSGGRRGFNWIRKRIYCNHNHVTQHDTRIADLKHCLAGHFCTTEFMKCYKSSWRWVGADL